MKPKKKFLMSQRVDATKSLDIDAISFKEISNSSAKFLRPKSSEIRSNIRVRIVLKNPEQFLFDS